MYKCGSITKTTNQFQWWGHFSSASDLAVLIFPKLLADGYFFVQAFGKDNKELPTLMP